MKMKNKGKIVSLSALASILGIHRNTLYSFIERGCPYVKKADRKRGIDWKFDSAEVVQWRLDQAIQDVSADTDTATEDELKRRKLAAETVLAELQTAKARGEVGSLDEFQRQVENASIEIRTRLTQMASRVAPMIIGLKNVAEVKRILRDEVDQALTALADDLVSSRD
jgi:phage terminase Nu1 subunit (DNA packaging protein)